MDINNALALGIQAPQVDLGKQLALVSQLRSADTQNALANMVLDEKRQRINALDDYRGRVAAGDPNAINAAAGQPDLYQQLLQNRASASDVKKKELDDALLRNAQGAQRVAGLTGPDQIAAWKDELDKGLAEKRIDQPTYQRLLQSGPNPLVLNNIIKAGLTIEQQIALEQKEKDRAVGANFAAGLGQLFGGNAAPTPASGGGGYFATARGAESGGDPTAQNPRSTAKGLYQFTDGTWSAVAQRRPDLGLPPSIKDATPQQQEIAARALTADNIASLASNGVATNDKNVYMAHFLGANGAADFIKGMKDDPKALGTDLVSPEVAKANPTIFFSKDGAPLPATAVYNRLTGKFSDGSSAVAELGLKPQQNSLYQNVPGLGTTIGGVPKQQMVGFLAAAASSPGLPENAQKTATEMLKSVLDETKPTGDQKEYLGYVAQEMAAGREPKSWMDYQKEMNASKKTEVNITEKGASKFEEENAKAMSARFAKISEEGDQGRSDLVMLEQMKSLGDSFKTGGSAAVQKWFADHGIKVGKNVSQVEAYSSLVDKLAPQQRIPGTGATSDFDAKMFKASLPRLINTPEGNALITDVLEAVAKDKIDRAAIAEQAMNGEITRQDAVKQLRAMSFKDLNERIRVAAAGRNEQAKPEQPGDLPALPKGFQMVPQPDLGKRSSVEPSSGTVMSDADPETITPGEKYASNYQFQIRPAGNGQFQVINIRTGQVIYTGSQSGASNAQASAIYRSR